MKRIITLLAAACLALAGISLHAVAFYFFLMK